jgi:hypothetical protein
LVLSHDRLLSGTEAVGGHRRAPKKKNEGGSTKQTGYPKQQSIPFYTQTRLMFIKKV